MNTLLLIWFGCGAFVSLMRLIQWFFDGRPLHAESVNDEEGEQYYYLKGLIADLGMSFLTGPLVLFIQFARGMPIFPSKRG